MRGWRRLGNFMREEVAKKIGEDLKHGIELFNENRVKVLIHIIPETVEAYGFTIHGYTVYYRKMKVKK